MKNNKPAGMYVLVTVCLIAMGCSILHAREDRPLTAFIESWPMGRIDWQNGVIYGVGRGYLHSSRNKKNIAIGAARVIATANILKIAAGVRLDDRQTLESFGKKQFKITIKGLVHYRDHSITLSSQTARPYYEITLEAPIKGIQGLTSNILDVVGKKQDVPVPAFHQNLASTTADVSEIWLVLDARNLSAGDRVNPALFPKIVSARGETIYSKDIVDEQTLVDQGMAEYVVSDVSKEQLTAKDGWLDNLLCRIRPMILPSEAKAEDAAEKKRRKKRRRYIVKDVTHVQGLTKTNLVISESDARELKEKDAASKILKKCRVIVIVSSHMGGIEGRYHYLMMAKAQ